MCSYLYILMLIFVKNFSGMVVVNKACGHGSMGVVLINVGPPIIIIIGVGLVCFMKMAS